MNRSRGWETTSLGLGSWEPEHPDDDAGVGGRPVVVPAIQSDSLISSRTTTTDT